MNHQVHDRPSQSPTTSELEIRIKLIRTIWGCATGMLGICIPLTGISHSTLIPFTVVVGATVATSAIWLGKCHGGHPQVDAASSQALQNQVKELEERLANMEAISLLERRLSERDVTERFPKSESMGPVTAETSPLRSQSREALRS